MTSAAAAARDGTAAEWRASAGFRRHVAAVRRNRYFTQAEVTAPFAAAALVREDGHVAGVVAAPAPETAPVFRLSTSIWAPRVRTSDSRSLYDTEVCARRRFDIDWQRMVDLGIAKLITRLDDDGGADEDGDGECDEVTEVRDVLWEWQAPLRQLFTFYATVGGDMNALYLNAWTQVLDDCKLIARSSKLCKLSDFDRLFLAVDGLAARAARFVWQHDAPHADRKRSLSRVEFGVALVHIAINKFLLESGEMGDVSHAVDRLIRDELVPRVDGRLLAEPNLFRRTGCYTEEMDGVLRNNEPMLRCIFRSLNEHEVGDVARRAQALMLSVSEWMGFLRAANLIGPDATERDGALCFASARMLVIDSWGASGFVRESELPFEGFLEALCRLSALKALPYDAEVEAAGCADVRLRG